MGFLAFYSHGTCTGDSTMWFLSICSYADCTGGVRHGVPGLLQPCRLLLGVFNGLAEPLCLCRLNWVVCHVVPGHLQLC